MNGGGTNDFYQPHTKGINRKFLFSDKSSNFVFPFVIPMINYLNKKGSKIRYYDPSGRKKEFDKLKNVKFYSSISSACIKSDLIIIHTEWNAFKLLDFKRLVKKKNFKVFDMRNIYSQDKMRDLKIDYTSIGR